MKRILSILVAVAAALTMCSCGASGVPQQKPQVSQMKSICQLATMECYYHNVAKFKEENAGGFFWNKKDKHFWIEYSGRVTVGIDISRVDIDVNGTSISIALPAAEIQGCCVDEASLTEDSFIIAENSIAPSAEDQTAAYKEANQNMLESAAQNTTLLNMAQDQAKSLIENYVHCIEAQTGVQYQLNWSFQNPDHSDPTETTPSEESAAANS